MKSPRILLVDSQLESANSFVSLGPLVLAAVSAGEGVPVEFVRFPRRADLPAFVDDAARADVVAFSCVCSNYPRVLWAAADVKRLAPSVRVVLGGPQATATADATLRRHPAVDLVLLGEAELAWAALTRQARDRTWDPGRIAGAAWRDGSAVRQTETAPIPADLDATPIPRFDAWRPPVPWASARVEVGRGCPFSCRFCSTSRFFSRRFRMKSPTRIAAEMRAVHATHGIGRFDFVHDLFTADRKTLAETCDALRGLPFEWGCWSRTDVLDAETLDLLHHSGCRGVFLGIESGSPRVQRLMDKHLDVQAAVRVVREAKRRGFHVTASLMLGYPGERREDLRDSLLVAVELLSGWADQVNLLPFAPLAGSRAVADAPLAFDGAASNIVATDQDLGPEELALVRADPELFSAFYYPADLEYDRRDYLAMVALLERLDAFPLLRRHLLECERAEFVAFLTRGGFGLDERGQAPDTVAEAILGQYAGAAAPGSAALLLLDLERALRRVRAAPGAFATGVLPAGCLPLLDRRPLGPGAGDFVRYVAHNTGRGTTVEVRPC